MALSPRCRPVVSLPLMVAALVFVGCKDTAHTPANDPDMVTAKRPASIPTGLFAADPQMLQQNAQFYFQIWNDTFTTNLAQLPANGQVPADKTPYAGSFYADTDGGTDQVQAGTQTTLQKYDQAFYGGVNTSSQWERQKHANPSGPDWAGHCNGFSAASQRHKEPAKAVVRNGVTFDPKDIKALLAELYMSADYVFLGGTRCDQTTLGTPDGRTDPTVRGACEGINPGTLHAAVANWVGKMHHTVIMDAYPAGQVWNYPLYSYTVLSNQTVTAAQAAQYIDGGSTYKFNPAAVSFALMQTQFNYAQDYKQEVINQFSSANMVLNYILELDAGGNIVGGEWAGAQTQKYFPGFLWVALAPMTPNGTAYMGNQYLDAKTVLGMWSESAGFDPNNPPTDIVRPQASTNWGKFTAFNVIIDGTQSGAAFAGKQLHMKVARTAGGALDGSGLSLAVTLNGDALQTVTTNNSDPVNIAFDPGLGLHRLEFTWTKGTSVVDDEILRLHTVR